MSKSNTPLTPVPAHLIETMLRTAMNGEAELKNWKDDLQHWSYTSAQLDQLVDALKEKKGDAHAKEIIEYIDTKIRK